MDNEKKIQIFEPLPPDTERTRPMPIVPLDRIEDEQGPDLLAYWRVIKKRRWTIATVFVVIFSLVLIWTLKQKPVYRAKALIEIQKENPDITTVKELFELDSVSDAYLETQYKVLASESLSRRVIEQLQLDKLPEFNPQKSWWTFDGDASRPAETASGAPLGSTVDAPGELLLKQRVLERFQDQLSIEPVKRSRLVTVSFESRDAQLSARVVNAIASNYIDQSLEARWAAAQRATEWISQQLIGLKAKVEKSEEELQKYAREHGLLYLEGEKGETENIVNARLRQLQEELTRAQAARYEKESLSRLVEAGDLASLPGVMDSKVVQDLTSRKADLQREHAQISTTFSPEYPRVKQIQSQIDDIDASLEQERERAAQRITNDYLSAVRRENLTREAFNQQQKLANDIAERAVQYNILKREVDTNKQLYEGLLQRLKEAGVSAGLKASNIRIVDPAQPPRKPVKPRTMLNLTLAALLGLLFGTAIAFMQEHLDDTLKTAEHVERFLRIPALAVIPSTHSLAGQGGRVYGLLPRASAVALAHEPGQALPEKHFWPRIDAPDRDYAALSEAFRSLRTSVLLSAPDHPPVTILVTSANAAEGKTTVSSNLAIALAQLGQRVLIVDADMRRASLHKLFHLDGDSGLVSYLTGHRDWHSAVQETAVPNLFCLVGGPIPPNPAELLSSQRMRVLVREVAHEFAFVIIDSPPVLHLADSRVLSTLVDGVVLVVKGGATPRDIVRRAQSSIADTGASIIGLVLNNLDIRSDEYGYYNYYGYTYGNQADQGDSETKTTP